MNLDRFAVGRPDLQEKEPKVIGECSGCKEQICESDEIIEFGDDVLHDKADCCQEYLRDVGLLKIAG